LKNRTLETTASMKTQTASRPAAIDSFATIALGAVAAIAISVIMGAPGSAVAQESTEELIERLKGGAGKAGGGAGIRTRGIAPRGGAAAGGSAEVKSEKRSVVFATRGIPASIQVAAEEDKLSVTQAAAGTGSYAPAAGETAVEVSYAVDSDSMVSRDNIFFKRGSDEFADEASFVVVQQLAEALKSPALAGLHYVVEGHASAEGSARVNQELSQRRAERIVDVLATLGADRGRLVPIGFGASQARFPANSEEFLRRQDRRVIIFRLDR